MYAKLSWSSIKNDVVGGVGGAREEVKGGVGSCLVGLVV